MQTERDLTPQESKDQNVGKPVWVAPVVTSAPVQAVTKSGAAVESLGDLATCAS
jgi:hypothetical protein